MRCVSSPDGDPVSFARAVADHGRGIRHSRIQRAKGCQRGTDQHRDQERFNH